MKRRILATLCMALLFLGIFIATACADHNTQKIRDELEEWFSEECSFSLFMEYRNLVFDGYSHEIRQENASDGGFHFVSLFKQWDRLSNYEYEEKAEYYYQFEDGNLVCYMMMNDQNPSRGVLSSEDAQMLLADKQRVVGVEVLLPEYLESFEFKKSQEDETQAICTFSLPLKRVLEEAGMMASLIHNSMSMSGKDDVAVQDVSVYAELIVESDTLKPLSLTFSFDELKPYLFSDGALSGEFAFGMNLMSMTYEFDYQLLEKIHVPEEFIP